MNFPQPRFAAGSRAESGEAGWKVLAAWVALLSMLLPGVGARAANLSEADLADIVMAPYSLGEPTGTDGVWTIETSDGVVAGYIFESRPLAPIPGFAGKPMNLLITLDTDGRFLDVTVLDHTEPIFVSGLGQAPFDAFLLQYRGLSVANSITVGPSARSARNSGSTNVTLDGVTKATASVRIANETILAAAIHVARERLQGIAPRAAARPRQDYQEDLDWQGLTDQGLARRLRLTNAELQSAFAGTRWADDDPGAIEDPEGLYLELYVIDLGPPSVARTVLDEPTAAALARILEPHEEPVLVLANGRHRLVDADFIRNTEPDRLAASQGELPVLLRDADLEVGLAGGVPSFEQALILRADTRLGFDPGTPWALVVRAVRAHGTFMPEIGIRDFRIDYSAPPRFFTTPEPPASTPPWLAALKDRAPDMALLGMLLVPLLWLLGPRMAAFARHPWYPAVRIGALVVVVGFVGWWAQGQLSIVTPLGMLQSAVAGDSLIFLLYEPLILMLWAVTLVSLAIWGRGLFCGWLCPYGALQELAYRLGRWVRLPELPIRPGHDRHLKRVKYGVLAGLALAALAAPATADLLAEVEPFKTAVTMIFDRPAAYVLYASFWLLAGVFVFKGFCRYVCPLGALLVIAGKVRRRNWIPRRAECGSPCQFCKARCAYGAIRADGRIDYDECFQCLDCVTIYEDPGLCIPEVLIRKKGRTLSPAPPQGHQ